MTSVTFDDFTPPPRFPPVTDPWVNVEIQEASTSTAVAGVLIDTIAFSDPDTDPTQPKTRSFTTEHATLSEGYYRVRFKDAQGDSTNWSAWVQNVLVTDPAWKPSVRQIADLLYTRTKDMGDNYVGNFTSTTIPNSTQVAHLINVAQDHVISDLGGSPTDPKAQRNARHLTQIYTAMLIELSFYSEQITRDISPYKELKKLYDKAIEQLEDTTAPDDAMTVVDSTGAPTYFFEGFAAGNMLW